MRLKGTLHKDSTLLAVKLLNEMKNRSNDMALLGLNMQSIGNTAVLRFEKENTGKPPIFITIHCADTLWWQETKSQDKSEIEFIDLTGFKKISAHIKELPKEHKEHILCQLIKTEKNEKELLHLLPYIDTLYYDAQEELIKRLLKWEGIKIDDLNKIKEYFTLTDEPLKIFLDRTIKNSTKKDFALLLPYIMNSDITIEFINHFSQWQDIEYKLWENFIAKTTPDISIILTHANQNIAFCQKFIACLHNLARKETEKTLTEYLFLCEKSCLVQSLELTDTVISSHLFDIIIELHNKKIFDATQDSKICLLLTNPHITKEGYALLVNKLTELYGDNNQLCQQLKKLKDEFTKYFNDLLEFIKSGLKDKFLYPAKRMLNTLQSLNIADEILGKTLINEFEDLNRSED